MQEKGSFRVLQVRFPSVQAIWAQWAMGCSLEAPTGPETEYQKLARSLARLGLFEQASATSDTRVGP
eukprot:1854528-Amphidinium_carterae.2